MSLAVRVIPCLDVDNGRVVKGVNFRNLRDAGDPVEMAKLYDAEGADELTFLDITASSGDRETTYDVGCAAPRSRSSSRSPSAAASAAPGTSTAAARGRGQGRREHGGDRPPELIREIAERFGRQVLVLSVDARRAPGTPRRASRSPPTAAAVAPAWTPSSGPPRRGPGRRRDPAEFHGRGRHEGRLRHQR